MDTAKGKPVPEPLFIFSTGRSFSSVVCSAIGMHPSAIGLPEVNLFVHKDLRRLHYVSRKRRPGALTGLKRSVAHLMYGQQTDETIELATEWISDRLHMTGTEMFRELIELADGRLVIDKSPTNLSERGLDLILKNFPNARYLHLTRHPMPTCRSTFKALSDKDTKTDPNTIDERWYQRQAAVMRGCGDLPVGQVMSIQGEWLLEEPLEVFKQICEWLGLDPAQDALEGMLRTEDSPFAHRGPESAPLGNNKGFIANPKFRIGRPKQESLYAATDWTTGPEQYFDPALHNMAHIMGYEK